VSNVARKESNAEQSVNGAERTGLNAEKSVVNTGRASAERGAIRAKHGAPSVERGVIRERRERKVLGPATRDQPGGATRRVTGPEKTDWSARNSWGSEL